MANLFNTSMLPATPAFAAYAFMTILVSAGWTVQSSSDGTTYNPTGNQITGGNTGAGGLDNNKAWFVISAPIFNGQIRSFCFQTINNNNQWRIKYSPNAGFIGGTPSAIRVPSATDEAVALGSGTDASPSASGWLSSGSRYSMMAGDASVGYSCYLFANQTSTFNPSAGFMLDVLAPGSYSSLDTDPAVVYAPYYGQFGTSMIGYNSGPIGKLGASFMQLSISTIIFGASIVGASVIFPATLGYHSVQNPFDYKSNFFPALWGRDGNQTAPNGYKGRSGILMTVSTYKSMFSLFSINSSKDYILFGNCLLPWDGSTPVI